MFLFCFFLNNKTALQHITIQLCSIAYLMNRKNYCRAESGFLMRPRVRVGFGLTSSGSGRVRAEPTRPDSIFDLHSNNDTKQQKVKLNNCAGDCEVTESTSLQVKQPPTYLIINLSSSLTYKLLCKSQERQ